jgi:hypothetical protein
LHLVNDRFGLGAGGDFWRTVDGARRYYVIFAFAQRGAGFLEGNTTVAKRTIHVLVDDLDGGEADETVKFALDGVQYEIDLSDKNAAKLRDAFAPFLGVATTVGRGGVVVGGRAASARGRGGAAADREQNKAIREWAQNKGIKVSDRGRIKQEIVDRFHAEAGR